MPILVKCACGIELRASDGHAGKKTRCPRCGTILTFPGPPEPEEDDIPDVLPADPDEDEEEERPRRRKRRRPRGRRVSSPSLGDNWGGNEVFRSLMGVVIVIVILVVLNLILIPMGWFVY